MPTGLNAASTLHRKQMKTEAHSRTEYFGAAGERAPVLRKLDKVIRQAAPSLKPYFVDTQSMSGLGYGQYRYKYAGGKEADWPVIGLATQKNHFSLYICIARNGKYLAELYRDRLGKVSCGKSCIRFRKLEELNLEVLKEICEEAATLSQSNHNFLL
jgi:hypothetical protein